jgi:uncharacterized protein (TIGR00645 family)
MERLIERTLLRSRWLLLPLYVGLLLAIVALYLQSFRELVHLVEAVLHGTDSDVILLVLSLVDLVLVANLVLMVVVSSYESYISPIDNHGDDVEKPDWLGKLDAGNVKVKVSVSIVMISGIHLLKQFMTRNAVDNNTLMVLAGVHVVFVVSALLIAWVDSKPGKAEEKPQP